MFIPTAVEPSTSMSAPKVKEEETSRVPVPWHGTGPSQRLEDGKFAIPVQDELEAPTDAANIAAVATLHKVNAHASEFTTSVVLSRCRITSAGRQRWLIRLEDSLRPDITVAARLTPANDAVFDYFIFPGIDYLTAELLSDRNPLAVDVYRFDDLSTFIQLAKRAQIEAA